MNVRMDAIQHEFREEMLVMPDRHGTIQTKSHFSDRGRYI
jgi:hypothetical protein